MIGTTLIRIRFFNASEASWFQLGYAVLCFALWCSPGVVTPGSARAETVAGTPIVNTAGLRYELNGAATSITSNTVTLIVAERLDVRLVRDGEGAIVVAPTSAPRPTVVPLTLTNVDNGTEAFALTATMSAGTIVVRSIVIDANGDGLYDPAADLALASDTTPPLAPGQSIKLLAIVAANDATAANATLTVTARSTTGSGAKGATYDGKGDGNSDAVVGPTGATASVTVPLTTSLAGPALIKSQSVRAADGSQNAVRDAVITYTLQARFTDAVAGARIADPIPDGTVFVPGSLSLDGVALTDTADGDAGSFDGALQGARIAVSLGQVAAASVHTVQFKAKIQ